MGRTLLLVAALLAIPVAVARADPIPEGSVWSEHYLESGDGTKLHADVFRPAGDAAAGRRTPVALVVSPYLGLPRTQDSPSGKPRIPPYYRGFYAAAVARGYTVAQVSLRGTGASGGCEDIGGRGDQADALAALRWAKRQPWSAGQVGMFGHSFDGFTALAAAAQAPGDLAAAIVLAPAVDLYRGAYMNGVPYPQGRAVAAYYQLIGLVPPGLPSSPQEVLNYFGGRVVCGPDVVAAQQSTDREVPFWRERDLISRLRGSRVPVLWAHGFLDGRDDFSSTRPDQFLDVWRTLRGPHRAWFGQWPHLIPGEEGEWGPLPLGREGFIAEELRWLDRHVKGLPERLAPVGADPPVAVQDGWGAWRSEAEWPPPDLRAFDFGQLPGSYRDEPGNQAEQGQNEGPGCFALAVRCSPASRTGIGSWTFTQPFPHEARLAGPPVLTARLRTQAPGVTLIAILYDVDAGNRATLLTRGASLVATSGTVRFELYPQDWSIAPGHRLGLLLTGSDDVYFTPQHTSTEARVEEATLRLPVLRYRSGRALPGRPSQAVVDRTTFAVDPQAIAARQRTQALPSPMTARPGVRAARIVLSVHPRRVRAAGRVRVRIRAMTYRFGRRRALSGVTVRFAGRSRRTNRLGRVAFTVGFGRHVLRATKPGLRPGRATVVVLPRR